MRVNKWHTRLVRTIPYLPFLLLSVLLLGVWEAAVGSGRVPDFILPAPTAIARALYEDRGLLFGVHLAATLHEVFTGLLLSVVLGVLLGVGMYESRRLRQAVYPLIVISQTLPLIALSPVFVLWFGYTLWSKVAIVFLTAFFPVVVGVYDGLRAGGTAYDDLLKTMGATRRQRLLHVRIPLALPSFFSGLKLAGVYSVIGATVGEWLGGTEGLGLYSRRMAGNLHTDSMFAAVVLLSAIGLMLFLLFSLLERLLPGTRKRKKQPELTTLQTKGDALHD